jgi:hypothetical protein
MVERNADYSYLVSSCRMHKASVCLHDMVTVSDLFESSGISLQVCS